MLQHPQAQTLTKPRALHETFKKYLESVTLGTRAGSNAVASLKTKVLSLDNPFKTTAAETAKKTIAAASRKQTAKLLSARRRRELGLHLLSGEVKYSDAEQLNDIWTRYVSQVIESELSEVQQVTEEAQRTRNAKLQAKLKYMDLSGCPLEGKRRCMCSTISDRGGVINCLWLSLHALWCSGSITESMQCWSQRYRRRGDSANGADLLPCVCGRR